MKMPDTSNRPTYEQLFAAVELAAADQVFFNWSWWDKDAPDDLRVMIICNDTFYYATADCERVEWDEVPALLEMYKDAPTEDEANKRMVRFIAERRGRDPLPPIKKWLETA